LALSERTIRLWEGLSVGVCFEFGSTLDFDFDFGFDFDFSFKVHLDSFEFESKADVGSAAMVPVEEDAEEGCSVSSPNPGESTNSATASSISFSSVRSIRISLPCPVSELSAPSSSSLIRAREARDSSESLTRAMQRKVGKMNGRAAQIIRFNGNCFWRNGGAGGRKSLMAWNQALENTRGLFGFGGGVSGVVNEATIGL